MKKWTVIAAALTVLPIICNAENKLLDIKDAFRNPFVLWIKLSPDAKNILAVLSGKKSKTLTLVDIEKNVASHLYKIEEGDDITDVEWIDNDTIYLEIDIKKSDESVKALVDVPNATRNKPEFHVIRTDGYLVNPLSEIDDQLLFAKDNGDGFDLYKLSPNGLIANDFDREPALKKTLDGKARYFYDEYNDIYTAYTFENERLQCLVLDKKTSKWLKIWESNSPDETFIPIGFVDEQSLAVLSNIDAEKTSLRMYDTGSQQFTSTLYEHPRYDLTSAGFNRKARTPQYVTYLDHGQITTHYFSNRDVGLERKLKKTFSEKQIHVVSENSDGVGKLIYVTASNDAGNYYYLDVKSLKAKMLFPRFDYLIGYSFAESENFDVEVNGEKIESILTKPINNEKRVLLVMPHGGPIDVRDADEFNLTNQYFASRGYSVLNVNFRGSSGFGKKFMAAGRGEFGRAIEQDVNRAVDEVLRKYKFDHICAIGASYGGYSAAMLAIQKPERYECAVSMFGVFDLPLLFSASNLAMLPARQKAITYVVGENSPKLKEISPVYLAEHLRVPILLIAGKVDSIATFEQTNRFKYQLKKFNKQIDTLFFDDVGHGHHQWRPEQVQYAYINAFLHDVLHLDTTTPSRSTLTAGESLLIADAFYFNDNVANDSAKSFMYYRKAAELGDARAMYNVGSFYHRGDSVAKDLPLAIGWYIKASDAGYVDASYRLGRMLLDPKIAPIQAEQSFSYFKKAVGQKSNTATLELAKAYALGLGIAKDFPKAMELLSTSLTSDYEKNLRQKILAEIAWEGELSTTDIELLKGAISSLYDDAVFAATLDDENHGIFHQSSVYSTQQGEYIEKYFRDEKTTTVPLKNGVQFGALLEIESPDRNKKRVALKYYWRTPASVNNTNRLRENGAFIEVVEIGKEAPFIYKLETENELTQGDWQLEVRTLDNQLLYSKQFKTVDLLAKPVLSPSSRSD